MSLSFPQEQRPFQHCYLFSFSPRSRGTKGKKIEKKTVIINNSYIHKMRYDNQRRNAPTKKTFFQIESPKTSIGCWQIPDTNMNTRNIYCQEHAHCIELIFQVEIRCYKIDIQLRDLFSQYVHQDQEDQLHRRHSGTFPPQLQSDAAAADAE